MPDQNIHFFEAAYEQKQTEQQCFELPLLETKQSFSTSFLSNLVALFLSPRQACLCKLPRRHVLANLRRRYTLALFKVSKAFSFLKKPCLCMQGVCYSSPSCLTTSSIQTLSEYSQIGMSLICHTLICQIFLFSVGDHERIGDAL